MFPTLALTRNSSTKADLKKDRIPLAFKETRSARDIYRKLLYQRVRSLHYQRLDKIKRSTRKPHRDGFSFSRELVFLFFS